MASLSDFQKLLQKVVPAVPPKSTLPVLEHLKLELTDNTLKVVATDQDISIMSSLAVETSEEGGVLVPARRLNEIIRALDPTNSFTFTSDEDNYDIQISTDRGKYSMKGLSQEEYLYLPELFESEKPNVESGDLDETNKYTAIFEAGILQKLANKTSFAISADEYRPSMSGALFQFRDGYVNTVATDSFRLVRAKAESDKFKFVSEFDALIPARMMEFLKKIEGEAIMSMIENMDKITHVRVDYDNTVLISRVIGEKFPPYESVIPTSISKVATIDGKELLAVLKRVSLFSNKISKLVRVTFDDSQVSLFAEEESSNSRGDETLPCDYLGDRIDLAFNHKNLEEMIANIEQEDSNLIEFQFSDTGKPVLIMPKSEQTQLLSLIMPIRT